MERTFFGQIIRDTTYYMYPHTMNVYQFADYLGLKDNHAFISNIENIKRQWLLYEDYIY